MIHQQDNEMSNIISECDEVDFKKEISFCLSPNNREISTGKFLEKNHQKCKNVRIKFQKFDTSDDGESSEMNDDFSGALKEENEIVRECMSTNLDLETVVDDILSAKRHPSISKEKKRRFKMTTE